MARVFISHSNLDNQPAARLKDWLVSEGFEAPFLDFDKHAGIPPGAQWERVLYNEIARCQAFLILQTANWSSSKWCFAEFTQARALGKDVFQVIVDDQGASLDPIAPDIQRLDLRLDEAEGLQILKSELIQITEQNQGGFPWPPPADPERSPYPGLMVFEEQDAAVFFGRDSDCRNVIESLNSLLQRGGGRLLVIQGASGSGKSSLLRAGVLPRLRKAGRKWSVLPPFIPQIKPLEGLAQSWALALGRNEDWRRLYQQLKASDSSQAGSTLLVEWAKDLRMAANTPTAPIILAIDQAEELFTLADKEETNLLIAILTDLLSQNPLIQSVLTIRVDELGRLQSIAGFANRLDIIPLSPIPIESYREVIEGPARVAGIPVETAFVERAIRDTQTEDALPLLAFALRRLYDQIDPRVGLTLAGYQALGDDTQSLSPLENALRSQADGVLKTFQPSESEKKALRKAFVPAMVWISDQGLYTRRVALWDNLPEEAHRLLNALVKERLLIKRNNRENQTTVQVAHEALFRVWPDLADLLKHEQEFALGVQQLEQDFRLWQEAPLDRKGDALLTGLKLTRGSQWMAERGDQLSPNLRDFIQNSIICNNQLTRKRTRQRRGVILGAGFMSALITLSLLELVRFESGVFPYSVVTGYVENFLVPAIEKLKQQGENPVFVVMMPQSYADLDHKKRVERYRQQLQAAGYSVNFRTLRTERLPRGATIAELVPQPPSYKRASRTLLIDAASTVTTFRNVIDYKKKNLFYGFSGKDAMVAHYVDDFKQFVYALVQDPTDRGRIIFATTEADLLNTLNGVTLD